MFQCRQNCVRALRAELPRESVAQRHRIVRRRLHFIMHQARAIGRTDKTAQSHACATKLGKTAERHVAIAEMTLEMARRQVEGGRDVVLVLDSLTRLARAYNTAERGTGRTLSGGIDSGALEKPKRFFRSARLSCDCSTRP